MFRTIEKLFIIFHSTLLWVNQIDTIENARFVWFRSKWGINYFNGRKKMLNNPIIEVNN